LNQEETNFETDPHVKKAYGEETKNWEIKPGKSRECGGGVNYERKMAMASEPDAWNVIVGEKSLPLPG